VNNIRLKIRNALQDAWAEPKRHRQVLVERKPKAASAALRGNQNAHARKQRVSAVINNGGSHDSLTNQERIVTKRTA